MRSVRSERDSDGVRWDEGERRVRETERVVRERSGSPDKDERRSVVRRTASMH